MFSTSKILSKYIFLSSKFTANQSVPVNGPVYMDLLPNNNSREQQTPSRNPEDQILHTYMDLFQNASGTQGNHPETAEECAHAYDDCLHQEVPR